LKKVIFVELYSNLAEFNPDIFKADFNDVWPELISHSNDIKTVYKFEKKKYQSLFKQIFMKKEMAQFPKIISIGKLEDKTRKELKIIKYGSCIGFCDYFYEVENNNLLHKLFESYSNNFEINESLINHFREDEKKVLLNFFDQIDDESKLITVSHDGNPIFIIFFSEEAFNYFSKRLNNLNV
jgi:hypothetical protein